MIGFGSIVLNLRDGGVVRVLGLMGDTYECVDHNGYRLFLYSYELGKAEDD